MKKATFAVLLVLALLFSTIEGLFLVNSASANFFMPSIPDLPHIYIRSNGTVEPSSAPVQRLGNTYILTRNLIAESIIEVQRDNVIIDGSGHTIQGTAPYGITVLGRSNITIKNFNLNGFNTGISIRYSCNVLITASNFSGNEFGIALHFAVNNTIVENFMSENGAGILAYTDCDFNRIMRNQLVHNRRTGIWFESGETHEFNSIVQNNISSNSQGGIMCRSAIKTLCVGNIFEDNGYGATDKVDGYFAVRGNGISISSSNNTFVHNNFINNYGQVGYTSKANNNTWDNGAEGNYWSNYEGADNDSDGIGDTPYLVNSNAQDNYPIMAPIDILAVQLPPLPVASVITIPPIPPIEYSTYNSPSSSSTQNPSSTPPSGSVPEPLPNSLPPEIPNQSSSQPFALPQLDDEAEPEASSEHEPFPTVTVIAVYVAAVVVLAGLLVYFKKRKH